MRNAFASELTKIAQENSDVVLLSGDIGNRMFDEFKKVAPNRFYNCGIAESNMMSMAAGMALSGLKPFVYTITPFTTTRCLEQIKVGVAYHDAPVTIVGTGSGLSYAELGPTHHSFEDIAIIRSIPGMRILTPSDRNELVSQLRELIKFPAPSYMRIGKKGEPLLFNKKDHKLGIAKGNVLKEGEDILILGIGPIINESLNAAKELSGEGISVNVASLGSVRPLDEDFLRKMVNRKFKNWVTLEEHGFVGGFGSTILEWLLDNNLLDSVNLKRIAIKDEFIHELGDQKYVRNKLKIDKKGIKSFLKKI